MAHGMQERGDAPAACARDALRRHLPGVDQALRARRRDARGGRAVRPVAESPGQACPPARAACHCARHCAEKTAAALARPGRPWSSHLNTAHLPARRLHSFARRHRSNLLSHVPGTFTLVAKDRGRSGLSPSTQEGGSVSMPISTSCRTMLFSTPYAVSVRTRRHAPSEASAHAQGPCRCSAEACSVLGQPDSFKTPHRSRRRHPANASRWLRK